MYIQYSHNQKENLIPAHMNLSLFHVRETRSRHRLVSFLYVHIYIKVLLQSTCDSIYMLSINMIVVYTVYVSLHKYSQDT